VPDARARSTRLVNIDRAVTDWCLDRLEPHVVKAAARAIICDRDGALSLTGARTAVSPRHTEARLCVASMKRMRGWREPKAGVRSDAV